MATSRPQRPIDDSQQENRTVPYEQQRQWSNDPPSPFGLMRRLSDEMDRMFGDFMTPFGTPLGQQRFRSGMNQMRAEWMPPVEVFERDNQMVVRAELPGMSKEDVHVEVDDDALLISGERREEQETNQGGFRHSERRYGRFLRRIPLPEGTDPNQIQANYRSGLLEVTLPMKRQERRSRQVEIRDEGMATRH